jgi:hypothetical protein
MKKRTGIVAGTGFLYPKRMLGSLLDGSVLQAEQLYALTDPCA